MKTIRTEEKKKQLINRLSRIEGQVRGIKKMIENDAYCIDVLNQTSSVAAALSSFDNELISDHMHTCLKRRLREGDDSVIEELTEIIKKR